MMSAQTFPNLVATSVSEWSRAVTDSLTLVAIPPPTASRQLRPNGRPSHSLLVPFWTFMLLVVGAWAQPAGSGAIEGRVSNGAGGGALRNAVVSVVGSAQQTVTEDDGAGALNDPLRQYVRDARQNLVLGANGQPVFLTADLLERAQLRYVERGARADRSYGDWYPSFNASYHLTENLVLRAAYARTLGRPDYNFIVPGATFSEPTVAQPTITVSNTGLKPWTGDNFDLSLETYQIKGGSGSIGAFRKKIKDFFGGSVTDTTPELLARYGLPNDPLYLNYDISTQTNVGDATITGYEFAYSQSLFFLPAWARGLQVFGSATRLELSGNTLADFTGYSPRNYSGGINFVRPRFYVKFTVTHQGVTRGPFITPSVANGIPADTYTYQGKRLRYGINAQYSFSKAFSVYGSIANLGGFIGGNLRYSPTTPGYMKERRRQEFPSTVQIGIKGQY